MKTLVTLSYDDAHTSHYEYVAPLLESHNLRGTFYITGCETRFRDHLDRWKRLADSGHELGNHTLFHPCRKEHPEDKPWLHDAYNLCDYTEKRFKDEVEITNWMLNLADGQGVNRTYGNTCHESHIGRGDLTVHVADLLGNVTVGARGGWRETPRYLSELSPYDIGVNGGDSQSTVELIDSVQRHVAFGKPTAISFAFHDVTLIPERQEHHRQFVEWLGKHHDYIDVLPLKDVAEQVKKAQSK